MNQQARADSTEALLDVIRGSDGVENGNGQGCDEEVTPSGKTSNKVVKSLFRGRSLGVPRLSMSGEAVIGVDITQESICLAKFAGQFGRGRLLGLEQIELGPDEAPGSPHFEDILTSLLARHVIKPKKTSIWTMVRSSEVDVSTLKLPKMPARRLSSAVYWQLQKDKKFEEQETVLDFRVQGTATEDGLPKLDVLACLVNRADVEFLDHLFNRIGYPLTGITVLPASFQSLYKIKWVPDPDKIAVNIHVDTNFTSITIMEKGKVLFSRTIRFGVMSIAEDLIEHYKSGSNSDELSMPGEEAVDDRPEITVESAVRAIVSRVNGEEVSPDLPGGELDDEEFFEIIFSSLDRMSRQSERTLDYVAQHFNVRCEVIHLSGEIFNSPKMCRYLMSSLGMEGSPFRPLKEAGRRPEVEQFIDPSTCMRFTEAVSLATCNPDVVVNLKQTYKEREQIAAKTFVSNLIALVALIFVALGAGCFVYGGMMVEERTIELQKLQGKLDAAPVIDEAKLQMIAGKAKLRNVNVRDVCSRYRPLAVLTEISDLMPDGVRLLSMELALGDEAEKPKEEEKKKSDEETEEPLHTIVLDGIVLAGERDPETLLARLLANLESSELLENVTVLTSEPKPFIPEGEVMHFVIEASLS